MHRESTTSKRRHLLRFVANAMTASAIHPAAAQESVGAVQVGNASLDVQFHSVAFDLSKQDIRAWVGACAKAVAAYLGEFPVTRARIEIHASDRLRGVSDGRAWGVGGARLRIGLGLHSTEQDLDRDWVLTHEMLHFAFPNMERRHHWIEEGVATYAEPMARAHSGIMSASKAWAEMIRDMPQGLPKEADVGLDHTHTWGRTYWGGAIFCLLADVRIRQATNNRKGLPQALRAINVAGGNITVEWPIVRALSAADRALGITVLRDLHDAMGTTAPGRPFMPDLDALWKQLGVSRNSSSGVTFNDNAPLATVRRAMLSV